MKIELNCRERERIYDLIIKEREFYAPCGGKGICGKCKIKTISGKFNEVTEEEKKFLTDKEIQNGIRAACYLYGEGNVELEYEENESYIQSINYKVNDDKEEYIGICDLGTTTVEIEIYNNDKELVSEIKFLNPQRKYGNDIISRAEFGTKNNENIKIMQSSIVEKLNKIRYINNCKSLYIAGNSVMQHIFAGSSTKSFLEPPYNPLYLEGKTISSKDIELSMKENGVVEILENIGGFVGGDSSAIIEYYSRNPRKEKVFLVIDLGTNGEVLLFNENSVYTSSTAAGPAFEAVSMECGMNALEGAVTEVKLENGIETEVIGGTEPKGICGSGYISLIAELLYTGSIDKKGTLAEQNILFPEINKNIFAGKFNISQYIYISQKDIREIQSAKAAIAATVEILSEEALIDYDMIEKIILTGNFGGKLTTYNVEMCKILPFELKNKLESEANLVIRGLKSMFINCTEKVKNYKIFHIKTAEKGCFEKKFIKNMNF